MKYNWYSYISFACFKTIIISLYQIKLTLCHYICMNEGVEFKLIDCLYKMTLLIVSKNKKWNKIPYKMTFNNETHFNENVFILSST